MLPNQPGPVPPAPTPPLPLPDDLALPDVFRRVCEAAADALGVERVGIWLLVNGDKSLRCANLFERSKRQHSRGATLQVADFPRYFEAVASLPALPTVCAREDPRTAELREGYLGPLGITSMLDAPMTRDGRLIGVLCHEHVGPAREWTTADREFARTLADLVVARMRSAEIKLARTPLPRPFAEDGEHAAALGRLAAGVAHDFKNLLTVILGNAELILRKSGLPPDVAARAGQIAEAAARGDALVRELLDFGRESAGAPRVLDVPAAVSAFVPLLQAAAGPGHPVAFIRDPHPGRVLIDRGQLERCLLNLVLNARDAMPRGGPIRVMVGPAIVGEGQGPVGEYVRIDVTDSGPGISAQDRERIFEPFYTTKPLGQGSGLGLAVVHRAVDRTGGFIRVESEVGHGATFRLFLPRVTGGG